MKRASRAGIVVSLVAGSIVSGGPVGLSLIAPAEAQDIPIREPLIGLCLRPVIGEGGILNLPLIDIPGKRIPNEPTQLSFGGQYNDCR